MQYVIFFLMKNKLSLILDGEASGSAKPISTIGVKRKTEAGEVSPTKKVHLENGDAK